MLKKRAFRIGLAVLLLLLLAVAAGMLFRSATAQTVPILLYHNLTRDASQTNALTCTDEKFRADLAYLTEQGYTSILPSELVEMAAGSKPWPEKPVLITFDDGYLSNYQLAYPILQEAGHKAVICLITANVGRRNDAIDPEVGFLSWAQAAEMEAGGVVEMGSHSYDLHNPETGGVYVAEKGYANGIARRSGEEKQDYEARIYADLTATQREMQAHLGHSAIFFAYPYGQQDQWFLPLAEQCDILVTVTTQPRLARIRQNLQDLPRYTVKEDTDLSSILP